MPPSEVSSETLEREKSNIVNGATICRSVTF